MAEVSLLSPYPGTLSSSPLHWEIGVEWLAEQRRLMRARGRKNRCQRACGDHRQRDRRHRRCGPAASRVFVPLASSWASSRTHTIVEGRAAGGEARPRSTGQQEAHLAKAGFRVQLVDMQLEATGRAASPRSQGGEVKSSAVLLRTLASASAFAPSKLCDPAEHI